MNIEVYAFSVVVVFSKLESSLSFDTKAIESSQLACDVGDDHVARDLIASISEVSERILQHYAVGTSQMSSTEFDLKARGVSGIVHAATTRAVDRLEMRELFDKTTSAAVNNPDEFLTKSSEELFEQYCQPVIEKPRLCRSACR